MLLKSNIELFIHGNYVNPQRYEFRKEKNFNSRTKSTKPLLWKINQPNPWESAKEPKLQLR